MERHAASAALRVSRDRILDHLHSEHEMDLACATLLRRLISDSVSGADPVLIEPVIDKLADAPDDIHHVIEHMLFRQLRRRLATPPMRRLNLDRLHEERRERRLAFPFGNSFRTMTEVFTFVTASDCLLVIGIGVSNGSADDDRYTALIGLAEEFRVPIVSIFVDFSDARSTMRSLRGLPILSSNTPDPLADEAILEAVSHHKRRKLILAGYSSEGAVTFMALSALARGFDVYVVEDLRRSSSDHAHRIAMNRLAQAGTVLTTALQLGAEWTAFGERRVAATPRAI